jgi:hypothetical protein
MWTVSDEGPRVERRRIRSCQCAELNRSLASGLAEIIAYEIERRLLRAPVLGIGGRLVSSDNFKARTAFTATRIFTHHSSLIVHHCPPLLCRNITVDTRFSQA